MSGTVTRIDPHESKEFPEMLAGVKLTKADPEKILHLVRIGKRIEGML
jgi:hypothetical protein